MLTDEVTAPNTLKTGVALVLECWFHHTAG
jgi:hypothetical protein